MFEAAFGSARRGEVGRAGLASSGELTGREQRGRLYPRTLEQFTPASALRLVRADSGVCEYRWLSLLEERRLPYIVVGVLHHKITSLLRKETIWQSSAVPGTDVSELIYRGARWSRDRRLILIRHRLGTRVCAGGKMLIECPGYAYQALVISLPATVAPIEVWRDYNGRAGIENVIKEQLKPIAPLLPRFPNPGFQRADFCLGGLRVVITQQTPACYFNRRFWAKKFVDRKALKVFL